MGDNIGVIKGYTRSLDYSSYERTASGSQCSGCVCQGMPASRVPMILNTCTNKEHMAKYSLRHRTTAGNVS